ncbi:hypothetical protein FB562_0733 [Homoserinimonas aerilata]|uniref:VOC domain-containing protein n=1 Tax=Homoserinimonas aerilata TaxID=1162970 RepID=A0A542YHS6_9MICO|nr:VOC family protein [Homoserinimonas aerilata]TQL47667.1 hypothetical protein FB562_0733 [Homoserinimonas aerilata]
MQQRVHFLTFSTPDLDAARAFYREGLGWHPLVDVAGEVIFFQVAPGTVLGLFDAEKFAQDAGMPSPAPVAGVTLSHNVDSAEEVSVAIDRLASLGAELLKPAQVGAFGGIFHGLVRDPNGIVWEVAHNPGWSIGDDGGVTFG